MAEVLIVDDDPSIVELLTMYLEKAECEVRSAVSGPDCLDEIEKRLPDIILLDIMLPELDGYEVCQAIRQRHQVPIIFVTARDDEVDPIIGLELGADDYIAKPFNPREVVARTKAVLRRVDQAGQPDAKPVRRPGFEIDPGTRDVRVHDTLVPLTPREFDIVLLLAKRPRIVFPRSEILQTIWGYDSDYMEEGVVSVDAAGDIVVANASACALLGVDAAKITGQPLADLLDAPALHGATAALISGNQERIEEVVEVADRSLRIHMTPSHDDVGEFFSQVPA